MRISGAIGVSFSKNKQQHVHLSARRQISKFEVLPLSYCRTEIISQGYQQMGECEIREISGCESDFCFYLSFN